MRRSSPDWKHPHGRRESADFLMWRVHERGMLLPARQTARGHTKKPRQLLGHKDCAEDEQAMRDLRL